MRVTDAKTNEKVETPEVTEEPKAEEKPKAGSNRPAKPKERIERYEVRTPKGETVTVEHNLETGATKIV